MKVVFTVDVDEYRQGEVRILPTQTALVYLETNKAKPYKEEVPEKAIKKK